MLDMKTRLLIRGFQFFLLLGGGIILSSCSEESVGSGQEFKLYYPAVSNIAPGTNISISPTWKGGTPNDFSITDIKHEGLSVTVECFSVASDGGTFRIENSDGLSLGRYEVSIGCSAGGQMYDFPGIISIQMMKKIADGISVEPSEMTVSIEDVLSDNPDVSLPTARITAVGENFVNIGDYHIANVYRDGILVNDCREWFELSEDGVFTIVSGNGELEPGLYEFDFKLTTFYVDKNSEDGLFPDALSLRVTSAPKEVIYTPSSQKVEKGMAATSVFPFYKGSVEGLRYDVRSVSPDNIPGITVNPDTGEITFPASSDVETGDTYEVSLTVTNEFGSRDFDDVYSFEVIGYIAPVTDFSYKSETIENISGQAFSNEVEAMDGAEVLYSFKELPAALSALHIDVQTGKISLDRGVELPVGEYTVTVTASNSKGQKDASFDLNVIRNPNHFTYVRWGNNLGSDGTALRPLEKYGNQFRAYHGSSTLSVGVQESDIPQGRPVTYKVLKPLLKDGTENTYVGNGIDVNSESGLLKIYPRSNPTDRCYLRFVRIEVTVGEGEIAVTRCFPVFVDLCGYNNDYLILYTPFAVRVNPKTGGESNAPTMTRQEADGSITDVTAQTSLDYRANSYYFNLDGPQEHTSDDKIQNIGQSSFLYHVWKRYFDVTGTNFNTSGKEPMSWWINYEKNWLDYVSAYVDHLDDKKIKVNKEMFKDADGNYADGVFMGTMNFSPSGGNPMTSSDAVQVDRAFIWLDPDYNEADYSQTE